LKAVNGTFVERLRFKSPANREQVKLTLWLSVA
jgi:hypothetical protein